MIKVACLMVLGTFLGMASFTAGAVARYTLTQEKSVLVTPVAATVVEYEIVGFEMRRWPEWRATVIYKDNTDKVYTDTHSGTIDTVAEGEVPAMPLIVALNKADLSVKSLERRLLEHLIAEGKIPNATISGSPR